VISEKLFYVNVKTGKNSISLQLYIIVFFFNHYRQGSTVCEFTVQFENPKVVEKPVTEAPPVKDLNSEKVFRVFVEVVQSGNVEDTRNLDIDTSTLSLKGKL
jgi:hypothetical protein